MNLVRYLMLAFLLAVPLRTHGEDLIANGELYFSSYAPSGEVLSKSKCDFQCTIAMPRSTNWLIRLTAKEEKKTPLKGMDYMEMGCDGKDVYVLSKFKADKFSSSNSETNLQAADSNILRTNHSVAQVFSGQFPVSDAGFFFPPIWFGLASSAYLSSEENRQTLPPIWSSPRNVYLEGVYRLRVEMSMLHDSSLPKRAIFFSDGSYPAYSDLSKSIAVTYKKYSGHYSRGFTNAIFEVKATTNCWGVNIPQMFALAQFRPKVNGVNSNDLSIAATWEVSVTSIAKQASIFDFRPKLLEQTTSVVDFRNAAATNRGVAYRLEGAKWLATETAKYRELDRKLTKHLERERANNLQRQSVGGVSSRFLFTAFFFISGLLLLVIVFKKS